MSKTEELREAILGRLNLILAGKASDKELEDYTDDFMTMLRERGLGFGEKLVLTENPYSVRIEGRRNLTPTSHYIYLKAQQDIRKANPHGGFVPLEVEKEDPHK